MTSPETVAITVAVRDAQVAREQLASVSSGMQTVAKTAQTVAAETTTAFAKVDKAIGGTNAAMSTLGPGMAKANAAMAAPLDKFATSGTVAGDKFAAGMKTGVAATNMTGPMATVGASATTAAAAHGSRSGRSLGQSMMTGFMAVGIAGLIGKTVNDAVDSYTGMAVEVNALKRITGGTTESVSQLRTEFQLSGVDATAAQTAMKLFSKNLGVAAQDADKTAAMTQKLGFSFTDASGAVLPLTDILGPLADKFAAMPNGAEKTALAMQLFGKSGTSMLPFLNRGSEGLADLAAKSDELGLTLNDTALGAMANAKTQQREWDASIQAVKISLGAALLPVMTMFRGFLSEYFIPVIQKVSGFFQENASWLGPLTLGVLGLATAWKILNVVMNTNPIVLIATAIIALVGTIIWAYQNVEWFREGVDKAWAVIKDAWAKAWVVIQPIMEFLWAVIQKVGAALLWLWQNVMVPGWNGIVAVVSWAWNNVIEPAWTALTATIRTIASVLTWLWQNVVVPVWNGITEAISRAWTFIIKPTWDLLMAAANLIGTVLTALWNTASNVWQWISDKISGVWNWLSLNVFPPFRAALDTLGSFFGMLWQKVSDVWTWIQDKVSTVWNWINQNVFAPMNLGIMTIVSFFQTLWSNVQTIWNNVTGFFGNIATKVGEAVGTVKQAISDIKSAVAGFLVEALGGSASGGMFNNLQGTLQGGARGMIVAGTDPGRRDNMVIAARSGEAVMVPEFTKAVGPQGVHNLNRMAEAGTLGQVFGGSFATGGIVGAGIQIGGAISDKLVSVVKQILGAAQARLTSSSGGPTAPGGPSGPVSSGVEQWRSIATHMLQVAGQSTAWINDLLTQMQHESGGNPTIGNYWDVNARNGDPSIGLMQVIGSTFRSALLRHGFGSYIALGQTNPAANILASILYTVDKYGDLGAWRRRGFGAYDKGLESGPWPSGTIGINTSGQDEIVLTQSQARTFGGSTKTVTIAPGAIQITVGTASASDRAALRRELDRTLRDILADDAERRF